MKQNLLFWLIGISLLLVALDSLNALAVITDPLELFIISIKREIYGANLSVKNFGSLVFQYSAIKRIAEEREKFARESHELKLQLDQAKEENEKLRTQLQAPLPPSYQFVPAQVAGISRLMEITAGEAQNIKVGMTVVDGINFVGRVAAVSKWRSSVMLPTDKEISVPAKTSRGAKGIVVGQFGDKVILSRVLQKEPLFLDDMVFSSGEGGFPPNLYIGKITHIDAPPASVYKQAELASSIDYPKVRVVFVISSR